MSRTFRGSTPGMNSSSPLDQSGAANATRARISRLRRRGRRAEAAGRGRRYRGCPVGDPDVGGDLPRGAYAEFEPGRFCALAVSPEPGIFGLLRPAHRDHGSIQGSRNLQGTKGRRSRGSWPGAFFARSIITSPAAARPSPWSRSVASWPAARCSLVWPCRGRFEARGRVFGLRSAARGGIR